MRPTGVGFGVVALDWLIGIFAHKGPLPTGEAFDPDHRRQPLSFNALGPMSPATGGHDVAAEFGSKLLMSLDCRTVAHETAGKGERYRSKASRNCSSK